MEFGASIFFTDYSISPADLAIALEERGFDSVWAAEHSHIPVPRLTPPPGGGELPKRYYDVMDPFVTLTAAAAATKRLKVATGICLVIQRDTIQTAKSVASIDQISGGRFLFGIGGGWNVEEIEAHGTDFGTRMEKMREQMEAMKEIWTKSTAEYSGRIVKVPSMQTWPKPVQKPYPPILLGGAFPYAARRAIRYGDGWYPTGGGANLEKDLPHFREMAAAAGRDPQSLPVTVGGFATLASPAWLRLFHRRKRTNCCRYSTAGQSSFGNCRPDKTTEVFGLNGPEREPKPIRRPGDWPHLPRRRTTGIDADGQVLQQPNREASRLHHRVVQPKAHVCSAAEWAEGKTRPVCLRFRSKAQRVVPGSAQRIGETVAETISTNARDT